MSLKNTHDSYGSVTKIFHWTIATIIYIMLTIGFVMGNISNDSLADKLYYYHKATGITVLGIMVLRMLWRIINIRPKLPESVPKWQRLASSAVHYGLYILLFAMPLSGWIMSSANGTPPSVFGLFQMPAIVATNKAVTKTFAEIHELLAFVLIAFIVIHVAAALKHYFIDKDQVLQRMLPGKTKA